MSQLANEIRISELCFDETTENDMKYKRRLALTWLVGPHTPSNDRRAADRFVCGSHWRLDLRNDACPGEGMGGDSSPCPWHLRNYNYPTYDVKTASSWLVTLDRHVCRRDVACIIAVTSYSFVPVDQTGSVVRLVICGVCLTHNLTYVSQYTRCTLLKKRTEMISDK
jgi:hypothetical protein